MKIPQALLEKYAADSTLVAFVSSSLRRIYEHVGANPMVFFPEYTDHSIRHFELTAQSAADLATEPSIELISPKDAAVLTVACFLHDFGMYLTRDGFQTLIGDSSRWSGIAGVDDRPWRQLWLDFYSEATRFDDVKLRKLFGPKYRPVRPPPSGPADPWEDFDYLLVGEFLRRFHARLAYDIATNGLPIGGGSWVEICGTSGKDHSLGAMAGIVAASHGYSLRDVATYLEKTYRNRVNPRGVNAIYVAALLRIADFAQIQDSRAPVARTRAVTFKSGMSILEWRVHQSVVDIFNTGGDPEAIIVESHPSDVETFLNVRKWLDGFQDELDKSWAVLGEVFGRQTESRLNNFGIRIRRIKSNVDDVADFGRTVDYIPADVKFDTATSDLLKLLIGPLYSNEVGVGIRELVQNAVDAVREYRDLEDQGASLNHLERRPQERDVIVEIKVDHSGLPTEISIRDRGIGMKADVIREYFLKAGASFRRSEVWRSSHLDTDGRSRVLRSGRFGVGVLAAFLLGDRITVVTRHAMVEAKDGIHFEATLDSEHIALTRITAPVGTSITVAVPTDMRQRSAGILPPKDAKALYYSDDVGWYFLADPSYGVVLQPGRMLTASQTLPLSSASVDAKWRRFENALFPAVFWSYDLDVPHTSCNGIVIDSDTETFGRDEEYLVEYLARPSLSFYDRDGYLQVNLQRTALINDGNFRESLAKSVADDLIAYAVAMAPESGEIGWLAGKYWGEPIRRRYYRFEWPFWLGGRDAFVLNDPHIVASQRIKRIVVAMGGGAERDELAQRIRAVCPDDCLIAWIESHAFASFARRVKGDFQRLVNLDFGGPVHTRNGEVFVPDGLYDRLAAMSPGRALHQRLSEIGRIESVGGWRSIRVGRGADADEFGTEIVKLSTDSFSPIAFAVCAVDGFRLENRDDAIAKRWIEVLGGRPVPFRRADREALMASMREVDRLGLPLAVQEERRPGQLELEDLDQAVNDSDEDPRIPQ